MQQQTQTLKKFSDFAVDESPLEGEKIKIDDIVNKEIVVLNYAVKNSKFANANSSKYLTIQFTEANSNEKKVVFTGSTVLADQCEKYCNQIPFTATIKKIKKFYTFA